MNPIVFFLAALVLIPVARYFDLKADVRSALVGLEEYQLVPCELDDLDAALVRSLKSSKSVSTRKQHVQACAMGVLEDREIVLLMSKKPDADRLTVCCCIWSPVEWPKTTIRRRLPVIDLLPRSKTVGHPQFDKQRRLISEAPELMRRLIDNLIRFFPAHETTRKSFRLSSEDPRNESWGFEEHWIFVTDDRINTSEDMLQMAQYLIVFATEAEAVYESLKPQVTERSM